MPFIRFLDYQNRQVLICLYIDNNFNFSSINFRFFIQLLCIILRDLIEIFIYYELFGLFILFYVFNYHNSISKIETHQIFWPNNINKLIKFFLNIFKITNLTNFISNKLERFFLLKLHFHLDRYSRLACLLYNDSVY